MDTNEKLKNAITEEMIKLPKDSQRAISSFDWLGEAEKIAKANNLLDEEINDFQTETALVLIGLVNPDYYAQNIENNVGTSKDEAEKIANEALEKIFMPIAKKREEIIKENIKNSPPTWDKYMQFVLAGGDYSYLGNKPMAEAIREGMSQGNTVNLKVKSNV